MLGTTLKPLRRSGSRSLFKKKVTLWRSVTEVEMSAGTERTGGGRSAGAERTGGGRSAGAERTGGGRCAG